MQECAASGHIAHTVAQCTLLHTAHSSTLYTRARCTLLLFSFISFLSMVMATIHLREQMVLAIDRKGYRGPLMGLFWTTLGPLLGHS